MRPRIGQGIFQFKSLLEFQRRPQCVAEDGTDHGTAKLILQVGSHERGHGDGDEEEAANDNHSTREGEPRVGSPKSLTEETIATGTPKRLRLSKSKRRATRLHLTRGRFVYMLYNGGYGAQNRKVERKQTYMKIQPLSKGSKIHKSRRIE